MSNQQAVTVNTDAFDPAGEIQQLAQMVASVSMPAGLKDKADKMLVRLGRMAKLGTFTQEYEPVEQYIKWLIQIPWGNYSKDILDLESAKQELDKHHYGLDMVKDRVLEYLAVIKLQTEGLPSTASLPQKAVAEKPSEAVIPSAQAEAPQQFLESKTLETQDHTLQTTQEMSRLQGSSAHAPVLCFVGIQGVGKTSIAKSIANAMGRKFVRVSLGALGDVSQIRGIPKGQLNAEPGQIVKSLIRTKSMNPLILLDEIDKTSSESGLRSDLMAALLEILDPEQNSTFVDHYIDFPIDLSQCMFITTSNNLGGISAALLDRLEIIRFGSYTDDDKVQIARNYMLPKVREATGITEAQLSFDDEVWPMVVRPLGFDAGVRELERTLTLLARKVARLIVEGKGAAYRVTKENFRQFIPEDIGVYS